MTSINLNGNDYNHIIYADSVEINRVSLPEWINDATPDVDTNVWNLKPLKILYTLRVSNAEKWLLDQSSKTRRKYQYKILGITRFNISR